MPYRDHFFRTKMPSVYLNVLLKPRMVVDSFDCNLKSQKIFEGSCKIPDDPSRSISSLTWMQDLGTSILISNEFVPYFNNKIILGNLLLWYCANTDSFFVHGRFDQTCTNVQSRGLFYFVWFCHSLHAHIRLLGSHWACFTAPLNLSISETSNYQPNGYDYEVEYRFIHPTFRYFNTIPSNIFLHQQIEIIGPRKVALVVYVEVGMPVWWCRCWLW